MLPVETKIIKDINFNIPDNLPEILLEITPGLGDVLHGKKLIEELIPLCSEQLNISGLYKYLKINKILSNNVYLEDKIILNGASITSIMKGSVYGCIYAITLGDMVDQTLNGNLFKDDPLKTMIFNYISNSIIQIATINFKNRIKEEVKLLSPYSLTCSYSPGNNGWNFNDQRSLLETLDSSQIGLGLNEASFMIPSKSITGAFGIGEKDKIFPIKSGCVLCRQNDCFLKKLESLL